MLPAANLCLVNSSDLSRTFPKITQPHLKPSFFRPLPILGEEAVTFISGIVNFALEEKSCHELIIDAS